MTEPEPQCPECSRMLSSLLMARLEHEAVACPDCGTSLVAQGGVPVRSEEPGSDADELGGPPAVPEEALAATADARVAADDAAADDGGDGGDDAMTAAAAPATVDEAEDGEGTPPDPSRIADASVEAGAADVPGSSAVPVAADAAAGAPAQHDETPTTDDAAAPEDDMDSDDGTPTDTTQAEVTTTGSDAEVAAVDPSLATGGEIRPGVATDPAELDAAASADATAEAVEVAPDDATPDTTPDAGVPEDAAPDEAVAGGTSPTTPEVAASAEEAGGGTPTGDPLAGWDDADDADDGSDDEGQDGGARLDRAREGAAQLVRGGKVDPVTAGAFGAVGAVLGSLFAPGARVRGLLVGGLVGAATAWMRGNAVARDD